MLSVRTKQVASVTALVAAVVVALGALQVVAVAHVSLDAAVARAELLAHAVYQTASQVVPGSADPAETLRTDPGIRSLLESSVGYTGDVAYAVIVDTHDVTIASVFPDQEGRTLPPQASLVSLRDQGVWAQLRAIYSGRLFEVRQPFLVNGRAFGSIRIGLSMLLIQEGLREAVWRAARTALFALAVAVIVAVVLAGRMLRPIHMIGSGLTRLGRGEFNVRLDLPPGEEFRMLGTSFDEVSARLQTARPAPAPDASTDSVGAALEDALALFDAGGALRFQTPAMRALLPEAELGRPVGEWLPGGHACRALVERALATGRAQGPVDAAVGPGAGEPEEARRAFLAYAVRDEGGRATGAILVARNVAWLDRIESRLNASRRLESIGRLMAGVAHEVKNPLNAMTIHLELLRQKVRQAAARDRELAPQPVAARPGLGGSLGAIREDPPAVPAGLERHVHAIADSIKRLDEVMQGLLKFTRSEELRLQPVELAGLLADVARAVDTDARRAGVDVRVDCPRDLPDVNADPGMLRQALLNLATNACQAMPAGGTLDLRARSASRRRVEVMVADTGDGIPPNHLARIFDLYFTTKKEGSGIGLSLVYRIVQLHDGEIAVESTPGRGTTFRILLPQT